MDPRDLIERRRHALVAARSILGNHEAAPSRVVELRESLDKLSRLPVDVAEYYREALSALQVECYRAAMVFAWAGFIHALSSKMVQGYQPELMQFYPRWKTGTTEELLGSAGEFQILEASKKCGLIRSQELHIYKGWLSSRNQCAHPTLFKPSRNASLGYVDSVISEVALYI